MKVLRPQLIAIAGLLIFLLLPALAACAQTGAVRARVTGPVDMKNLVTLRGNVHPLARPEFDQGAAPDDLPMERMLLVLQRAPEQEAALRQLLDDQQVKSSPRFHQWLTPEQFGQQFGPEDSDVQALTDWLVAQGFEVTHVAAGRTAIEFSGTAGLVRQAFGTEIHKFRVNGEDHWANASDPQIPAALAPVVAGFASLNNFPRKPMYHGLGTFRRDKASGVVQPLFSFEVSGGYYFALGPGDFATIYNVAPLWSAGTDGTGQTIAVVGETNINLQDVADFRSIFGLPTNAPNIILNGPDPGILSSTDEPEADLDVEWSGAVARGATIDLVVSETTETTAGIDLSALYIIDNNLAPVMSESYGACEAELGASGNQFYNTLWEQGAAEGITLVLASGDSGSAGCDSANAGETFAQYGLGVSGLASTPFNVAVGGTDFNVTSANALTFWSTTNTSPSETSALSYIPEIPWNDSCASEGYFNNCAHPPNPTYFDDGFYLLAGSGGPSGCTNPSGTFPNVVCSGNYAKPSWQSGTGVPSDSARDVPDVAMFAGNGFHYSFYVFCEMDANASEGGSSTSCDLKSPYTDFQGGSGTSAAAQVFAGIMALVNQRHGRQGNANYVLYSMAAQNGASCTSAAITSSSCTFYDITTGNNSVICAGGAPNCSSNAPGVYGIMVAGDTAAYAATPGYDLTTGLGSVNAANLVNNWTSNFTPTTTSLSLNPVSLTHGQSVNFTVNVTSGSGTPAGDVSLIAQTGPSASNVTAIGSFPLSGGSVSGSTLMLPGGNYKVTAHYAGNGTFAASDSAGINVTVGKESSQTEVRFVTFDLVTGAPTYGATTAAYGSPYVLRMDVMHGSNTSPCASPVTGLIAYPCPSGALTVSPVPIDENPPPGSVPGSFPLNSQGYSEDANIQLPVGNFSYTASYAGDNSYTASTSSPTPTITITKAPTSIAITGSNGVSGLYPTSGPITVTVNTQSSGVAPTGTLQVVLNGTTVLQPTGTAVSQAGSSSGFASLQETYNPTLPSSPSTITAQYAGDVNYMGSSGTAVSLNTTDFSASISPNSVTISAAGQSASATLTVTPASGFTGSLTVTCAAITSAPGTNCTASPATLNITNSSPVTATITVTTAGGTIATTAFSRPAPPLAVRSRTSWLWPVAGLLALAALVGVATDRRRLAAWVLASALLMVGFWVACGGGSGGGGGGGSSSTPSGSSVSFNPSNLTFSPQVEGSSSAIMSTGLTNTGGSTLTISGASITGANAGDFSQTNDCLSTLAPSANCTFNITFTPQAAGSRTAALSVSDSASGSPQSVSLSGTGLAASTSVNISPTSLAFGAIGVGLTSAAQAVTVTNTGSGVLSVSGVSIGNLNPATGTPFAQTNNCGSSVAAGANCTIMVTTTPVGTGLYTGSLSIADSATGSPQTVNLAATGNTPPGAYTFGVTAVTGTVSHTVQLAVTVQ